MSDVLGNAHMQELGVHHMGMSTMTPSVEVDTSVKKEDELKQAEYLLQQEGLKDGDSKQLRATGYTVILAPYPKNPYRKIKTSASGVYYGDEDLFAGTYKSNETGEIEDSHIYIGCAKVMGVGPECKYVAVGDDVYYRNSTVTIPFNQLGYEALSEQNIICVIE